VALIEPEMRGNVDHDAASRLMGVVANREGPVIIVGVSPSQLADGSEVMLSIFTQEGLYRMRRHRTGMATADSGSTQSMKPNVSSVETGPAIRCISTSSWLPSTVTPATSPARHRIRVSVASEWPPIGACREERTLLSC
jgi:hypothetical protein